MTDKDLIREYFITLDIRDKRKLYEKVREKLAQKIIDDEDYLDKYTSTLIDKVFRNMTTMSEKMAEDAIAANIEINELPDFAENWVDYIFEN